MTAAVDLCSDPSDKKPTGILITWRQLMISDPPVDLWPTCWSLTHLLISHPPVDLSPTW